MIGNHDSATYFQSFITAGQHCTHGGLQVTCPPDDGDSGKHRAVMVILL